MIEDIRQKLFAYTSLYFVSLSAMPSQQGHVRMSPSPPQPLIQYMLIKQDDGVKDTSRHCKV